MQITGDLTPLHWLNATFLASAEAQRQHALEQIAQFAALAPGLLAAAGITKARAR